MPRVHFHSGSGKTKFSNPFQELAMTNKIKAFFYLTEAKILNKILEGDSQRHIKRTELIMS